MKEFSNKHEGYLMPKEKFLVHDQVHPRKKVRIVAKCWKRKILNTNEVRFGIMKEFLVPIGSPPKEGIRGENSNLAK